MAITFVNDAVTVDSDGGSVAANQPAGASTGQLALAAVTNYGGSAAADITPPAGWGTYREDAFSPSNSWLHGIYWKILAGGDPFTFTVRADYTVIYIAAYSGTDPTTPLVDTGTANSGSGTTATGLGVTVTTDNSFLFFSHVGFGTGLTTGPAGMNAREVNYDGVCNFYDLSVSAGATGNKTATLSSDEWSVTMGVIAPPGGGGGGGEVAPVDHSSVMSFPALCRKPKRDDGKWVRGQGGIWQPRRDRIFVPARKAA